MTFLSIFSPRTSVERDSNFETYFEFSKRLSGELIDLERRESIHARARIDQLLEWVRPVADELGVTSWLSVPDRNAAERQIARHAEGASMEQVFAEQVAAGERIAG